MRWEGLVGGFVPKGTQHLPPPPKTDEKLLQHLSKEPNRLPSQTARVTTRHTPLSQRTIAFGQYSTEEAITTDSKGCASPENPRQLAQPRKLLPAPRVQPPPPKQPGGHPASAGSLPSNTCPAERAPASSGPDHTHRAGGPRVTAA